MTFNGCSLTKGTGFDKEHLDPACFANIVAGHFLADYVNIAQGGASNDMIFNFQSIITYLSQFVTLKTGDLIYTGTPSGVSAVKIGDQLIGTLNGEQLLSFEVK